MFGKRRLPTNYQQKFHLYFKHSRRDASKPMSYSNEPVIKIEMYDSFNQKTETLLELGLISRKLRLHKLSHFTRFLEDDDGYVRTTRKD